MLKRAYVNIQNIKKETANAVMISLPHKSNYDGYVFWFPKKLIREGTHSYEICILIPENFKFKAIKYGKKKKIKEISLEIDDILECFPVTETKDEEIRVHVPEKLAVVHVEIDKELMDE